MDLLTSYESFFVLGIFLMGLLKQVKYVFQTFIKHARSAGACRVGSPILHKGPTRDWMVRYVVPSNMIGCLPKKKLHFGHRL